MIQPFRYQMSVLEHLEELRGRLLIALIWFAFAAGLGGWYFNEPVLSFIQTPLKTGFFDFEKMHVLEFQAGPDGTLRLAGASGAVDLETLNNKVFQLRLPDGRVVTIGTDNSRTLFFSNLFTPFWIVVKVALLIGLFFSLPMWLWQFWLFIAPGMRRAERRAAKRIILPSVLLFPTGALFAQYVLTFGIRILMRWGVAGMEPWLDVSQYLSLVLNFMLVFGLLFQTPLIIIFLVLTGVVTTAFLRKMRKYAFLLIIIFSAILTPPDPFTMIGMGLPLYILYESSIWICWFIDPSSRRSSAQS
ncbi:twin-arginine translocase subunit TatC [Candidatus Sumerlaeota bacterium]|nr:twin-arginine translocase subunit TatC [Candidatus Sumerlaeota bacterium]